MTDLAVQAALVFALGTTGWEPGYAGRYDEQVMHRAASNHGLPMADCMASDDLARLDSFVWIGGANTGRLLSCQVSDYSAPPGKQRHMRAVCLAALKALDADGKTLQTSKQHYLH